MFEATHRERIAAAPESVWALWADPSRWPEWNPQFERAESPDELEAGADVRVKYRRGGTVVFELAALEPERALALEARFPGARLGHEHRLTPRGAEVEVQHRISVTGPLSGLWALMLGRKRMREAVAEFAARERELVGG